MIILGTNSIKETGYDVANSLRFNDDSTDYLSRTPSSDGNRKTWTFSTWIKRGNIGIGNPINVFGGEDGGSRYSDIMIGTPSGADDTFWFKQDTGTVAELRSTMKLRDTAAWYHLVFTYDSTDSTAADRMKMYVNGVRLTSFVTNTNAGSNVDSYVNTSGDPNYIGIYQASSKKLDAYLCETVLIDGTALAADSFGEFDSDSGIWKPIDVSGLTFGNNGFYLDFEDSSALGNDANGSNNFTVNNIAATDQATDTCTNNFSVLNPLDNPYPAQPATFSQGNLIGQSTESGFLSGASTIGVSTGKWYAEFKLTAGNMGLSTMGVITDPVDNLGTTAPHDSTKFYGVRGNGDKYQPGGTQTTNWAGSYTTNDIISLALDVDNNYLYVAKNGQYADGSGNYDEAFTGSPAAITIASGQTYFFTGGSISTGGGVFLTMASNFGFPSFAISSGNADSNGYGNFEYAVPSGYFSLNTKNLAEYG